MFISTNQVKKIHTLRGAVVAIMGILTQFIEV